MDKNGCFDTLIFSEDYLTDTDPWCELKKVYFYALALSVARRVFELHPRLDSLSYFSKFAYDVVADFIGGAASEKLPGDLLTARASLNRLLEETEEDACNCERMKNGAFYDTAVMHEAIMASIGYIEAANPDVLMRDLSSMRLNPKDQTCESVWVESYAHLIENIAIDNLNELEDELDKEREQCIMEEILDPEPNPAIDLMTGTERRPPRELRFSIPAVAWFHESKDHRRYYRNKLRRMYAAVGTTEMADDDYEAINWCIADWNWFAAKLFREGKLDMACSIAYAVLTESVRGFSTGKLLERLTGDADYGRKMNMRLYDTRTLFSCFLRHSTEGYARRVYRVFMNMEEDPTLPAFLHFEMSSVSRAAARVLEIEY